MTVRPLWLMPALCSAALCAACGLVGRAPAPTLAPTRTPRSVPTATPAAAIEVPAGDQIGRGSAVYAQSCATCHGPNLEGGLGPRLDVITLLEASGGDVTNGSTAARLYTAIRSQMPYGAAGSLSPVQYYDVTAFLLSRNGVLPADTIVAPATAPSIRFRLPPR